MDGIVTLRWGLGLLAVVVLALFSVIFEQHAREFDRLVESVQALDLRIERMSRDCPRHSSVEGPNATQEILEEVDAVPS